MMRRKSISMLLGLFCAFIGAQNLQQGYELTLKGAWKLAENAKEKAKADYNKEITVAIVGTSGQVILVAKGDGVGVHNTEAARRKAFTAVSTKTATLALARKARENPDSNNLNTLPELLLLSGGVPIWFDGKVIGAIGIAGGGGAEKDDIIAKSASIEQEGIIAR